MVEEASALTSSTNSKSTTGGPDEDGSLDNHANGSGGVGINILDEFKIDDGGPDEDGSSDGHASSEGHKPDNGIDDGGARQLRLI